MDWGQRLSPEERWQREDKVGKDGKMQGGESAGDRSKALIRFGSIGLTRISRINHKK